MHIHGTIDDYDNIQFGSPDNDPDQCEREIEVKFSDYEFYAASIEYAVMELSYTLKTVYKDQQSNYNSAINFLDSKVFDELIIMGHSFWGVDFPYYKDVIAPLLSDCKWTVFCYTDSDVYYATKALNQLGVDDYCIKKW